MPVVPPQDHTPVRDRHILAVHRAAAAVLQVFWHQVGADLVTIEVKIDPTVGTAADFAAEQVDIKCTGRIEILDRKCEVEWANGHQRWNLLSYEFQKISSK